LNDWAPGAARGELHELLPLAPAPLDRGPRDVVLLVDGSGSMEGAPFENVRAAAQELVGAALPRDRVSLRFFTAALEREHVIKEREGEGQGADPRDVARRLLAARVPGGMTMILGSLAQLAAEREREAVECLVLLLTDGRERDALHDPAAQAAEVRDRLRAANVRLVPIAVGSDPDPRLLAELVRPGEEVLRAGGLADLEAIFRREVSGARVREAEAIAVVRAPAPAGSLAGAIEVAGGPEPPPVERLVRDRAREGAEVPWRTERGEPVLGIWRVGLGRAALFASAPLADWAGRWAREPAFFGPHLRWLARGTAASRAGRPRVDVEEESLVLRGLDAGWPAVVAARALDERAHETTSAPAARAEVALRLALPAAGAGADPLARREVPLAALGELARGGGARVLVVRDPRSGVDLALPFELGPPPEFGPAGGRGRLDAALFTDAPRAAPARAGGARAARPFAAGTLGAGLALAFLGALLGGGQARSRTVR
jgi:hypothetical protein